jgi:hypothetical protein
MICTVMEAGKGVPYLLLLRQGLYGVHLYATFNFSC